MTAATRRARLQLTPLEDRTVPAGFGYTWVNPDNITFSFVPDGTSVGAARSTLSATLGASMTTAVWTGQIESAFQAWTNVAGIALARRADDGTALGVNAPIQGSSHYGDIRIAAVPLSGDVVAITDPPDLISPLRGTVLLNSNDAFTADGAAGSYQLYTVVLHEIGLALGLGENATDPAAAMYETYLGPKTGPDATDIAAVQALYGPQVNADAATAGNAAPGSPTALSYITAATLGVGDYGPAGQLQIARATLTAGAVDNYTFTQPGGSTTALVSVLANDISLLQARVRVFDASGGLVATAAPAVAGGNTYALLTGLTSGAAYTVEIDANPGTAFAVGGYRVGVGAPLASLAQQVESVVIDTDGGVVAVPPTATNGTPQTATDLGTEIPAGTARWDASVLSQFASASSVQTFKLRTAANTSPVMLVAAWSESAVTPLVTVTDAAGRVLTATVLSATGTTQIVQVQGIAPGTEYYVSFAPGTFGGGTTPVAYRFGIDFPARPVVLPTLAAGTLTSRAPQTLAAATFTQSSAVLFTLSAADAADAAAPTARLTVLDAAGVQLLTLTAANGQTASGLILLPPGTYTVVIAGATADGSAFQNLAFTARYEAVTSPIAPQLPTETGTLAASTLTSQAPQEKVTMTVSQSATVQFTLSASDTKDTAATAARLTVFSAAGKEVLTVVAANGKSAAGQIVLAPGTYTVVIVGGTSNGSSFQNLTFSAKYGATVTAAPPPNSPPPTPVVTAAPVSGKGFLSSSDPYSTPF
jgi:hypothetical protein